MDWQNSIATLVLRLDQSISLTAARAFMEASYHYQLNNNGIQKQCCLFPKAKRRIGTLGLAAHNTNA